ncbi:uncharacterized protein V1518DRAFT_410914 [Limtongia smithiae]|uniref:uncharacterized protein n=1 Tax=Limtongia smithiae TaxID=1125753 RepID=UPI0034CEDE7C
MSDTHSSLEEQIQAKIRRVEQQSSARLPPPPSLGASGAPGTIPVAVGGISARTRRPVPPPPGLPPPPPGLPPQRREAPGILPPPVGFAVRRTATNTSAESDLSAYGTPSQTLYVNNLNDKIKKDELRLCLYTLFTTYGNILDVVALKNKKMRGQAHIVFGDVASATFALRALQGINFLGKELRISFAKSKSNAVAKMDGTYRLPQSVASADDDGLPAYDQRSLKRTRDGSDDDDEDD